MSDNEISIEVEDVSSDNTSENDFAGPDTGRGTSVQPIKSEEVDFWDSPEDNHTAGPLFPGQDIPKDNATVNGQTNPIMPSPTKSTDTDDGPTYHPPPGDPTLLRSDLQSELEKVHPYLREQDGYQQIHSREFDYKNPLQNEHNLQPRPLPGPFQQDEVKEALPLPWEQSKSNEGISQPATPLTDEGTSQPAKPLPDKGTCQPAKPLTDEGTCQPAKPLTDEGTSQPATPLLDKGTSEQPTPLTESSPSSDDEEEPNPNGRWKRKQKGERLYPTLPGEDNLGTLNSSGLHEKKLTPQGDLNIIFDFLLHPSTRQKNQRTNIRLLCLVNNKGHKVKLESSVSKIRKGPRCEGYRRCIGNAMIPKEWLANGNKFQYIYEFSPDGKSWVPEYWHDTCRDVRHRLLSFTDEEINAIDVVPKHSPKVKVLDGVALIDSRNAFVKLFSSGIDRSVILDTVEPICTEYYPSFQDMYRKEESVAGYAKVLISDLGNGIDFLRKVATLMDILAEYLQENPKCLTIEQYKAIIIAITPPTDREEQNAFSQRLKHQDQR
ncbi:uncharacterized protein [Argopecten irradians]|uniref:uncharacterized protein n=1 Tax=Argopecten irradians TaxID=31199 RepID=UPI0037191276